MKKIFVQTISSVVLLIVLAGCASSTSKEGMQKDLQKDAGNALKNETKPDEENHAPANGTAVMTVADATKFLSAADANKGKLVTISAYPKGMTKVINGEFQLYVSDKTGTGLTDENFACNFKEEMKDAVKTHKADNLVRVTGNIAWNNGMIVLKNSRLAE
jgi:hypothetical protein